MQQIRVYLSSYLHPRPRKAIATMGRHKEWRRIAKRERRRRIRTNQAKARENVLSPSAPEYDDWLKEQEALELFEYEQIEQSNNEENEKWIQAESKSLAKWKQLQDRMKRAHQHRLEKEARIKQEWEEEQKKIKEAVEKLKQIEEQKKIEQDIFIEKLENFLSGDSSDPPPELLVTRETKPNMEICPFFNKTGCCRFGDQCSRNHRYPGISKTLLATNFFLHFGLENSHFNEYDTDVMLEFEESDTYKVFKEFFDDVVPEFEKFGKVFQFKVCNNYEKHLRGNTYVQYRSLRAAAAAHRALHCRWYGGRQLALQFCQIDSWKNAICGLQSRKRCPKGRACNFLHVFRNPHNLFNPSSELESPPTHRIRTPRSSQRSWRWSESPEVEIPRRRSSKERSHRSDRRHKKHSSDRHPGRSRSSSRHGGHLSARSGRD